MAVEVDGFGGSSQHGVEFMRDTALSGRSILVVEEEPYIASQLEEQFRRAGAKVFAAARLKDALHLVEHPALSAAVVNLRLDGDSTTRVCHRLTHHRVPFIIHTRHDTTQAAQTWPNAPIISKPADSGVLLKTVVALLH